MAQDLGAKPCVVTQQPLLVRFMISSVLDRSNSALDTPDPEEESIMG